MSHDIPISGPELVYFLGQGRKAFRHGDRIWLRLPQAKGKPKLFPVSPYALEYEPRAVKDCGVVIRASDAYIEHLAEYARPPAKSWNGVFGK